MPSRPVHRSARLQRALTSLGLELAEAADPEVVASTEARVEQELQQWGDSAHANLQQKTDDVKELLVVLGRTAATIGSSDEQYGKRFDEFTARLESIADLEDLTQIRSSLVRGAAELKSCVEQMSRNTRNSVAQLQADVVSYQTKLEEAEQLASRDSLTGLFNRARVTAHVEHRIASGQPFSVALIDLNPSNDHADMKRGAMATAPALSRKPHSVIADPVCKTSIPTCPTLVLSHVALGTRIHPLDLTAKTDDGTLVV